MQERTENEVISFQDLLFDGKEGTEQSKATSSSTSGKFLPLIGVFSPIKQVYFRWRNNSLLRRFFNTVFPLLSEVPPFQILIKLTQDGTGLDSVIWPLDKRTFVHRSSSLPPPPPTNRLIPFSMNSFWRKKAYAVLGSVERLAVLREDFLNWNVEDLLDSAIDIVVWMKTLEGHMQHLAVNAAFAKHCYAAGHSL